MDIEKLAFKDRTQLAHLNKLDLLDIIEFLQIDRKEWINQFTQTHNRNVDIQEENKELKKQLENYKRLGFKHLQDKNNKLETQQKEFRKYLEDYQDGASKSLDPYDCGINDCLGDVLSKYKEIIGVSDENKTTI